LRLPERTALVTGGLRGIGRAVADLFVNEGATVIVTDLDDQSSADALLSDSPLHYLQADVTSESDWQRVARTVSEQHGDRLHVLVNNAGTDGVSPVEEMSFELWRRVMSVNADGAFLGTKQCHGLLLNGGKDHAGGASIINVSSIMGTVGFANTSAYNASKGAIKMFTKATAIEFATKRMPIRANSIHPGFVVTPLLEKGLDVLVENGLAETPEDVSAAIAAMTPVGRLAEPAEVASVALFLACDDASYVTGSEIYVDGGWTAQ